MRRIRVFISKLIFLVAIASIQSCSHDPGPTCTGTLIQIDIAKTDATLAQPNGTIVVAAVGESKYFTYSIDNAVFQASNKFGGLDSGKYTVTVKNSLGCKSSASVHLVRINPCDGVTLTTSVTNASTGLSDGTITSSIAGGTGYTYSLNAGPFQAAPVFTGLGAGNYTVVAKNDLGCLFLAQVTLVSPVPCVGVTVLVTTTPVHPVLSQNNGSITANATGAIGFTFSLNGGAFQPSNVFNGLGPGTYSIAAKSADGCQGIAQVTLSAINPCAGLSLTITSTIVQPTGSQSDGSITASATGGTGFSYSLNGGAFQTSGTFNTLPAGNYTITAKNADGCTGTTQQALGASNPCNGVSVLVTASVSNTIIGQSTGSIVAAATGGTGFTFSINNVNFQSTGTFTNLAAGNYTIVAKSAVGCLGSTQIVVASTDPCAGVTISVSGTTLAATTGQANGSISVSVTGGSGFTYSLNNGAYQSSSSFVGLSAASYTVTAKSAAGCIGSSTFVVGSESPCQSITISITTTTTTSNNCVTPGTGTISVVATGSSGFTYNLNNGAYQAGAVFSALSAGTYTVGVKDVNGCTSTGTAVVSLVPAGPTFLAIKTLLQTRCSGSGCHTNGQTQKGYNFDTDCNIVKAWSGINGSTITGTLNKMPISPQSNLTTAEKQTITNWITAGHGFSN